MARCAPLLDPLYPLMKKELLRSQVIGTDDTSVKVLDRKLPFARIGRIGPYVGGGVLDARPAVFLQGVGI